MLSPFYRPWFSNWIFLAAGLAAFLLSFSLVFFAVLMRTFFFARAKVLPFSQTCQNVIEKLIKEAIVGQCLILDDYKQIPP